MEALLILPLIIAIMPLAIPALAFFGVSAYKTTSKSY